jgi:hypothetical protein
MPYLGPGPTPDSPKDLQGGELILDADNDTTITADTDDQIDIKIAGSDEIKITAAMIAPASADGSALGGASNEWSDLYLADSSAIYFGNDQEIFLTHDADTGLTIKHSATGDDKPITLHLKTGETDIAADDVLGKIEFSAPDEAQGTDAILVAAGIAATSEGDFSSSNNATKLSFRTAASEAASEKMTLSSGGDLKLTTDASVLGFGVDNDVTLTHVADTGILLNSTMAIQFNDASQYINAPSNAILDINATDEIELNATAVDLNGTLDVSGTLTQTGIATFAARPVFQASITIEDGGSVGSASDPNAVTISSGGVVAVTATTANTSASDGALTVAGGAGVAADLSVGDDLRLISDSAVLNFGADSDVTITHAADASLTIAGGTAAQLIMSTGSILPKTDTDTSNTGSVTLNFQTNQNFVLTFTGNVTLANPSTETAGQSGVIVCIQDGSGSRTLSLGTDYETAAGAGITLSTAANAVDVIPYFVKAAGSIQLGAVQKAFS